MKEDWKLHAAAATVDLQAAHFSKTGRGIVAHLRDAAENIQRAIDAAEGDGK